MAFQQGLSGLASSARALDVISSNVANASTVGFKASNAVFADNFASAMTGAMSNIQVGAGGMVNAVRQSFSQGGLTTTSNPLDMAINGGGFFQIERNNGTTAYSRNGQFDLDKDGFIVTPLGERLMGYQTIGLNGSVEAAESGTSVPLYVPPTGIDAKSTTAVTIRANLDSGAVALNPDDIDISSAETYNYMTSMQIFDSLGNEHTLSFYFVKDSGATTNPNTWQVFTAFDGSLSPATASTTLEFNTSGFPTNGTSFSFDPPDVPGATFSDANGNPISGIGVNLGGFSQNRSPFNVAELRQDGNRPGQLAGVSVTSGGIVQGRYSNGETRDLAQVALVSFRNPNGLVSLGNNLWGSTTESGDAVPGNPGTGVLGTLSSGQIEESNVDMSQELVQMIIQQRNYQANAKSITTQDQLLQTLINMR